MPSFQHRAMTGARMVCLTVGITLLLLLAMTRAWTTISPATIGKSVDPKRSLPSAQMSGSGSDGGNGSYEEQYNLFAEQQRQQREEGPRIVPQPNPIDKSPAKIHLQNAKRSDPIRNNNGKKERNQKAQEELEMAFLDFISCYPTKKAPQMDFMKPPEEQENDENELLYSDSSESLDLEGFSQDVNGASIDGAIEDDIITVGKTESSAPAPASLSMESNPSETAKEDDFVVTSESVPDSVSSSTEYMATTIASSQTVEDVGGDDAASESSYFDENLESEITNSDSDGSVGDGAVESNVDTIDTDSNSGDNYYTVEVKVETTFPTGITVEGAKNGWLEFCWAKGGGIVVPAATAPDTSTKTPAASTSTDPNEAPPSIKFQTEEAKAKARLESEVSKNASDVLDIPTGIPSARELMVPLGLKQELVSSTSTLDEIQADTIRRDVVTYKTTQRGFFCKDMIQGTHEGRVEFIGASYTSTRMIWTVTFQVEQEEERPIESTTQASPETSAASNVIEFASTTKTMVEGYSKQFMDSNPGLRNMVSKANLWGSWSQFQLKTASQNLIAYLDNSADSIPVMEHTETLPVGVSPREAMEVWYDYYWKNGGGTVPIVMSPTEDSDKRWVIPSGLEEELVSLEYDHPVSESGVVGVDGEIATETEIAKAVYRVNNPNLLTYPVYYHRATVRFVRDGEANPTQLFWKVKVKPYRKFLGGGVLFWTKNGIALAAKNLRNYLELRQLERREKELQAQLERLREQKPDSTIGGSNAESERERSNIPPPTGFKTIRSTVSISSGPIADSVDEAKDSVNIRGSTDNNEDSDYETTDREDGETLQTPMPSSYTGERTIAIPPRTIEDRPTIPIDSHTHAVNDELDEEFWQ